MVKGLVTLIKLQKRKADELQKRLAVLNERKANLIGKSEGLRQELEQEVKLAGELAGLGNFFGNFSEMIKKKQQKIAVDVMQLDKKIDALADEVKEVFSEQKKYEITLDRRKEKERKRLKKVEQNKMDEVASRKHLDTQS